MKDIEKFLERFHSSENVDEVFTRSCCYWFAIVLFGRFIRDGATIMYDEAANHFATRVKGKVYDITGDVTDKYKWVPWESITDSTHRAMIIRDYIMF